MKKNGNIRVLINQNGKRVKVDIPTLIRITRAGMNLSQSEFGDKFYTTGKTVSHWETGITEPSEAKLKQILKLFNKVMNSTGL